MRCILPGLVVLLFVSPLHAAPFVPDVFSLEVTGQGFGASGMDTLCVRCEDGDPANDAQLQLHFHGGTSGFLPFPSTLGSLDIGYFTAFGDLTDIYATFQLDVVLTLFGEPPLVGITPGLLIGSIFGDSESSSFTCCFATINTTDFGPLDHLSNPLMGVNGVTLQVFRPTNPQVTAVPEPLSAVLVATGLGLRIIRRSQRQKGNRHVS